MLLKSSKKIIMLQALLRLSKAFHIKWRFGNATGPVW